MTENQELQAFDETLKEFLKEPDHFLTSLALVNHLQRTPVLAAQDLYAVEVEGKKVVPVFTNEQDLQSFKSTQESAREQTWVERSSLDVLTQLVQAELFGLAFNLKEDGDFSNTTLFASSELIQFINYFTQTLNNLLGEENQKADPKDKIYLVPAFIHKREEDGQDDRLFATMSNAEGQSYVPVFTNLTSFAKWYGNETFGLSVRLKGRFCNGHCQKFISLQQVKMSWIRFKVLSSIRLMSSLS
jgi:hypothetical protein